MVKSITLEQAKRLSPGTILYMVYWLNSDGTAVRWRVNGQPKTWKTMPKRVQVPVKNGLYSHGYLTEDNLDSFSLTEPPAVKKSEIKGKMAGSYHR